MLDRSRRLVLRDQARRKIEQALREHACAVGELLRVSHHRDVVLHVLVRPAARMSDKRELRKDEAELGEEAEHLAGNHLDVVLAPDDDKPRNLVANEDTVGNRDLVLDAVHPLGHFEIERRRRAPANRRGNDDRVRPMHEGIIDAVQLVARIHLRDRARPGPGLCRLRIVTLAGPKLEIVEPYEPRFDAEVTRRLERMIEQIVGAREARIGRVHYGCRDAGKTQRPWRTFRLARERMRSMGRFGPPRRRRDVDEYAAAFDLHRERRHTILFESRFTDAGATMELPTVPRTDDVIALETALAEWSTDVIADIRHRAELPILERDRKGGGFRMVAL